MPRIERGIENIDGLVACVCLLRNVENWEENIYRQTLACVCLLRSVPRIGRGTENIWRLVACVCLLDQRIVPCLDSPPASDTDLTQRRDNFQRRLRLGLSRRRNTTRLHPYWSAECIRAETRIVPDIDTLDNEE